jgi:hypothetical protein
MKIKITSVLLISAAMLTGCSDIKDNTEEIQSNEPKSAEICTTPINYDYANLGLHLNSLIDDPSSKVDWDWDHMNAFYGMPDTTGVDYYRNIQQPTFSFHGETTLPTLSVITNKKRITQFSATIIFHLEKANQESIENLLDSLTTFDLLKNEKIRKSVIDNHRYNMSNDKYEETIELKIFEKESRYDQIVYEIKMINPIPHHETKSIIVE